MRPTRRIDRVHLAGQGEGGGFRDQETLISGGEVIDILDTGAFADELTGR